MAGKTGFGLWASGFRPLASGRTKYVSGSLSDVIPHRHRRKGNSFSAGAMVNRVENNRRSVNANRKPGA